MNHVFVPIDQISKDWLPDIVKKPLPSCPDQRLKFICSCSALICLHCAVIGHRQEAIEKAAEKEKIYLKQFAMKTQ